MWRNIIVVAIFVVSIGGTLGYYLIQQSVKLPEVSQVIDIVSFSDLPSQAAGGDIIIAPPNTPPELPPLLPERIGELPDPTTFSAEAMIVKDVQTGALLYGKNQYESLPIASITKLMSARVFLEKNIDWSATTTVTNQKVIDTHMYAGDTYSLKELWLAGLIGSSNKAIISLSEAVGWPQVAFVERMNQVAAELGMTDTQFREPTGLDAGNISSASDLAILLKDVLQIPTIQQAVLQEELTIFSKERQKEHHLWNTNWLLLGWIPNTFNLIGGKTGYIPASGYNFSMQVTGDNGKDIIVIVLGTNSHEARFTEARDIANAVYDAYQWPTP